MLEKFDTDIWTAAGPQATVAGFHYPTRMVVIRLTGERLFIWSPVPLTTELRSAIEALGTVSFIVAPNSLHHLHLPGWLLVYPDAQVFAPPGLRKKRDDIAFTHDLADAPDPAWADEIDQVMVHGNRITTEVVFFHKKSRTILFCDLIQQFPDDWFSGWRRIIAKLDLMVGKEPSVPRKFRVAFNNRREAREALNQIEGWPADKVLMAHGQPVITEGSTFIKRAFSWLK